MWPIDLRGLRVSLPRGLFRELEEQSERLDMPIATLARRAIEERVHAARRAQVEEELRRYVAAVAGSEYDLDEALEEAGAEAWLRLA